MTLPVLRLSRTCAIGKVCILGQLRDIATGEIQAVTLELPDDHKNTPFRSCIPAGIYTIRPFTSQHLGRCFAFDNSETSPRRDIRLHVGNTAGDVEGCAVVGSHFGLLSGTPAVLASKITMHMLLDSYPDGFTLHIESSQLA